MGIGQSRRRRRRRRAPRGRARGFSAKTIDPRGAVAGRVETRPRVCEKHVDGTSTSPRRARDRAAAAKNSGGSVAMTRYRKTRGRARGAFASRLRVGRRNRRFLRFLSRCACSRSRGLTLSRALRRPRLNARARGRPRVDARAWAFVTHLTSPNAHACVRRSRSRVTGDSGARGLRGKIAKQYNKMCSRQTCRRASTSTRATLTRADRGAYLRFRGVCVRKPRAWFCS